MKHLEEAIEKARSQENLFFLRDAKGNSKVTEAERYQRGGILFFPRKKLRMQKIRSNYRQPLSWFIQERLDERATRLEEPTEISHEGLTSGFRSAIIKETGERYLRLKGVSQVARVRAKLGKETSYIGKGLCFINEAIEEQARAITLLCAEYPFIPFLPVYIETHLSLTQLTPNQILRDFGKKGFQFQIEKFKHLTGEQILRRLAWIRDNLGSYFGKDYDFRYRAISALEIKGDTRLDEAIYQLTRKQLSGERREIRDEILYNLCFNAGIAKAGLTCIGYSWGDNHNDTNNHPGNFVLFSANGVLRVGICDLARLKHCNQFASQNEFLFFAEQELEELRRDLRGNTCSLPSDLPYIHFPEELRENCFNAIKTGYCVLSYENARQNGFAYKPPMPEKIVMPDQVMMTEREFRQKIDYVTG